MMLFTISAAMIGMSAAAVSLQYADAISNHKAMRCRYQPQEVSKCSQKIHLSFFLFLKTTAVKLDSH